MNANVDFREPIIQILAEPPGGDHRVDILMRRAHDPRVDGNLLAPADPLDHALLQETQQLDLERQRNVADFVEEQRAPRRLFDLADHRSEEHTSELQSLMRISYAVFCLKKKNLTIPKTKKTHAYAQPPTH